MIDTAKHTRASFLDEVIEGTPGGERIVHCLQCGSCGGSCPNGADMQYTPRTLFAMINANQRTEVLTSNTMWCCVSCYFCTTRCPQDIPITDLMYCLKRLAIRDDLAKDTDAPALAKTFTGLWTATAAVSNSAWPAVSISSTSRWRCCGWARWGCPCSPAAACR